MYISWLEKKAYIFFSFSECNGGELYLPHIRVSTLAVKILFPLLFCVLYFSQAASVDSNGPLRFYALLLSHTYGSHLTTSYLCLSTSLKEKWGIQYKQNEWGDVSWQLFSVYRQVGAKCQWLIYTNLKLLHKLLASGNILKPYYIRTTTV